MTDQATAEKTKKSTDAVHEKGSASDDASAKLSTHAQDLMKHPAVTTPGADQQSPKETSAAAHPAPVEATPAAQAARPADAAKPADATSHSWLDLSHDVYNLASSAVQSGWDKLSNYSDNVYKSILGDSDNKTSKVEPQLGADGKPEFFMTQTALGTQKLGDGFVSHADPKGGSIEKNSKTGELRSQSADGEKTFTRTSDGTEIFKDKNIEYSRTKDGKYQVRNDKGDVTDVNDQGAKTRIDHGIFSVAQHITNIDQTISPPIPGQVENMPDGQRVADLSGNVMLARKDGTREMFVKNGPHWRTDATHKKLEIEDHGNWRAMNSDELKQLEQHCHFHQHTDVQGHKRFQVNGVDLETNGKIVTADKESIGEPGAGGKMIGRVPTKDGTGATATVNADGSSDLLVHGHDTKVNPNDPKHLVQGFKANPDGSLGPSDFNYNSENKSFNTDGVNWDQYGDAALAWNGCNIDSDGDATYSNGSSVFNSGDYADAQELASSVQYTQQSCTEASAAISTAVGKLGSNTADASDLGSLMAASGDLDAALANAMASENFGAVVALSQAKGSVATAIDAVAQQLAKQDKAKENTVQFAKANNLNLLPEVTFDSLYG